MGPAPPLTNYRLTIRYDGRNYLGWQRHGDDPTIQGALEQAITAVFGVRSPIQGSGRTDRGAHALGQVASVRLPSDLDLDPAAVAVALNMELAEGIEVCSAEPAPDDFHARMSATSKRYRYVIWNAERCPQEEVGLVWHIPGALDVQSMRQACPALLGRHDFASFATRPNFKQKSTVRELTDVALTHDAPRIELAFSADGFLYKMVRNIVRTLVKVGEGRYEPSDLPAILAARDRAAAPGTAPASGLYLDEVFYDDPDPGPAPAPTPSDV